MPYSDRSEKEDMEYLVSTFKYKGLKPADTYEPPIEEHQSYLDFLKEWICSIFK